MCWVEKWLCFLNRENRPISRESHMVKAMGKEEEKQSDGQLCAGRLVQPRGKVSFREQYGVVQQSTVIRGHSCASP